MTADALALPIAASRAGSAPSPAAIGLTALLHGAVVAAIVLDIWPVTPPILPGAGIAVDIVMAVPGDSTGATGTNAPPTGAAKAVAVETTEAAPPRTRPKSPPHPSRTKPLQASAAATARREPSARHPVAEAALTPDPAETVDVAEPEARPRNEPTPAATETVEAPAPDPPAMPLPRPDPAPAVVVTPRAVGAETAAVRLASATAGDIGGAAPGTGATGPTGTASDAPGGPDIGPEPLSGNPRPHYPPLALRRGYDGMVLLRLDIDRDGHPVRVRLAKTSGHEILDDAAIEAVGRWRFAPARLAGIAVAATVEVPIRFELTSN